MKSQLKSPSPDGFDYIIVGSGAGGAPLAARLVQYGFRVLIMEAGSDATHTAREVSEVPSLHAASTEHPDLSWQFFVKHFSNPPCGPDGKATPEGIFYPRAATLGGCTVHNSMITIAGPDADWDNLADFVGDDSWRSQVMRTYFQKLEKNEYIDPPGVPPEKFFLRFWDNLRWLFGRDPDYTGGRHGFKGWLRTSWADICPGLRDAQMVDLLKSALQQVDCEGIERFGAEAKDFLHGEGREILDPNHATRQSENPAGVSLIPISVSGDENPSADHSKAGEIKTGRRSSPRDLLLQIRRKFPDHLTIWTECFVTKVLFQRDAGTPPSAIGVEYYKGGNLYAAHVQQRPRPEKTAQVFAEREVILCGGAFNTPQLLMLSGIGEQRQLQDLGIECLVDLPGVGRNLQDRYEISVLSELEVDFAVLGKATFQLPVPPAPPDPALEEWRKSGLGLYSSNGAVMGIMKRSRPDLAQPDLFIVGTPLPFKGYEPGYSNFEKKYGAKFRRLFSWIILKAHTRNRDGRVTLRSADPLERPEINFHYFHEATLPVQEQVDDPDLAAMVDGVKFVRAINDRANCIDHEFYPGTEINEDEEIKSWIRREAWGHHACGSCRMGPSDDPAAVLDSRFRVRGVSGLRVVDASIFPKIPGYFIAANIYMASEKAADVIREDAKHGGPDSLIYPRDLHQRELAGVKMRRTHVQPPKAFPNDPVLQPAGDSPGWPKDTTGLALSGGGIRSATLNLGILQSLAKKGLLRRIDLLSTVSGGGYVGSFLGMFFNRLRRCNHVGDDRSNARPAPDTIEQELVAPDSQEISWLRRHGNYIASNGSGDSLYNMAIFIRNLIAMHFVVGVLIFGVFGVVNGLRYSLFDPASAGLNLVWSMEGFSALPPESIGAAIQVFWSPWFVAFELLVLFLVIPRIIAYWLVSPSKPGRFDPPSLKTLFVFILPLFYLSISQGLRPMLFLLVLSLLSSFIHVELSWRRGRQQEQASGTGGAETSRTRARNYLNYDLGSAIAISGVMLGFALIDTTAHFLHQLLLAKNPSYVVAFLKFGAVITACVPVIRGIASFFTEDKTPSPPSTMSRIFKTELSAGLLAVGFSVVPLLFYSFLSHAAYGAGKTLGLGFAVSLFALLVSFILAPRAALAFVNQSSLADTYAARLARAYLGASNPLRHHPRGADIDEVMASDDVGSIRDYRPHESGGPLHIINVTVNQTIDFNSQRGNRDRKAESLAVSSLGLTVGKTWHGLWRSQDPHVTRPQRRLRKWFGVNVHCASEELVGVDPVGRLPGASHPLVDETGKAADAAEMLSLRRWVGISGAAISPGRGAETNLGRALLFGLANLRTGYWWDSSIDDSARDGFPKLTFSRRLLYLLPRLFVTQSLLIFELIARYPGPWERYWYLSDGGFFENLAAYELVRRRVPRIIVSDGGADPNYQFDDLANLIRKVRIDFNARIEPFTEAEMKAAQIPQAVIDRLGTLDELAPVKDSDGVPHGVSQKHAALFWIHYDGDSGAKSVMLYFKATVTQDMPPDVAQYHTTHPEFPHESTADQIFDEAQWESYRKLGESTADELFEDRQWFAQIPL